MNEVSRNVDGYRLSTYLYKDRDSKNKKIFAGPAWDYDLAFRNANYCDGSNTNGWAYQFNNVCPGDGAGLIPFWWERLMRDTAFVGDLRCRWKSMRQSSISKDHLDHIIDSVVTLTNEARQRHFQRWPILGQYIWPNPNPIPTTYDGEINALKDWITNRLTWIDNNIPNTGICADWINITNKSLEVLIYPNPNNGIEGNIEIKTKEQQTIYLSVFDETGRLMHKQSIDVVPVSSFITIQGMKKWQSGIYYFVFVNKDGETISKKVMKY